MASLTDGCRTDSANDLALNTAAVMTIYRQSFALATFEAQTEHIAECRPCALDTANPSGNTQSAAIAARLGDDGDLWHDKDASLPEHCLPCKGSLYTRDGLRNLLLQ